MELLKQLKSRIADRKKAAATDYDGLVSASANGANTKPTLADAEKILKDAGKTPDDLESDVARMSERMGWKKLVDQLPKTKTHLADLEQQVASIFANQKDVNEEAKRQFDILNPQINNARMTIVQAEQAANDLRMGSRINDQIHDISTKRQPFAVEADRLRYDLRGAEQRKAGYTTAVQNDKERLTVQFHNRTVDFNVNLAEWKSQGKKAGVPKPAEPTTRAEDDLARAEYEVKIKSKRLAELDKEINAANTKIEKLQELSLQP